MLARHNPPLIAARSFVAAARHKSFLKAAAELHVTPAAISHQVKRLEEYLGQTLFIRLNRAVVLTDEGTSLALQLEEIFSRLEAALDPAQFGARSTIHISAMPSLAAKWLAPRLPDFEARHPQWQVRLTEDNSLVDFTSGNTDLALRYGAGDYPGFASRRWMDAGIFAVCSPALLDRLPLCTAADLRHHTLIHDQSSHQALGPPGWAVWLETAMVDDIDVSRGPLFPSIFHGIEAALAGHGVALAPEPLVVPDLASGRLVRPFTLELANPYAFWIVCPAEHLEEDRVRAFSAWLLSQAEPEHPD